MNEHDRGELVRRRRSWYRRRLRIQRGLIAALMVGLLGVACWQRAARLFAGAPWRGSQPTAESAWSRSNVPANLSAQTAHARTSTRRTTSERSVYPYSVIPGGVADVDSLRRAVQHDYVVWQHYARFQFEHARLVRATEAREVYLSYRLRNRIFWTRKKKRLHKGELLLTDGKITARTRCGNQVSESPKPEVSDEEPADDVFDGPVAELEPAPPLPFRSSFRTPSLPGAEPISPRGPELFAGGFSFPYVPYGAPVPGFCESPAQEQIEDSHGIVDDERKEKHCPPKRHRPPVVPEPSTIVLIPSGLAAVVWRYRKNVRSSSI